MLNRKEKAKQNVKKDKNSNKVSALYLLDYSVVLVHYI